MRITSQRQRTGLSTGHCLSTGHWPLATGHSSRRRGYTLIELMITMALIMLIMAILATSFAVGLDTFGRMKALGDMAERLRAAVNLLREDLQDYHFEGSIRPSDPAIFTNQRKPIGEGPPFEGFFRVDDFASSPAVPEGVDAQGIGSFRDDRDVLHMAVRRRGNDPDDFFSASQQADSALLKYNVTFFDQPLDARHQQRVASGKGYYRSQWAEVIYFLEPLPSDWTANGTPLYALHRMVRLAVVDNRSANQEHFTAEYTRFTQISWRKGGSNRIYFNSPRDLVTVNNRYYKPKDGGPGVVPVIEPHNPTRANQPVLPAVDNIILTDVVSFDIKLMRSPVLPAPAANQSRPFGYPLGAPKAHPAVANSSTPPASFEDLGWESATERFPILGIQITLRVWDLKTQQTRQVTLIQDL